MTFSKINCGLLLICLLGLTPLSFADQELLQSKDINRIMKQIFDQHVDKREMTSSIIKNSFKVYIDQFDPDRIYLLESEVRPFLQLKDSDISHYIDQYQQSQFPEYVILNEVIQKAILRAREIRSSLEGKMLLICFKKIRLFNLRDMKIGTIQT